MYETNLAILTDLSDVLIGGFKTAGKFLVSQYGEDTVKACYKAHQELSDLYTELLKGNVCEDAYWLEFFRTAAWPFSMDEAKESLSKSFATRVPGVLDLYKSISQYPSFKPGGLIGELCHGAPPVYIVSDHCNERISEVKSLHPELFAFVRDEYWSCDLGHIKRERVFFTEVLNDLGLEPHQVLFIDDDPINVSVAAGIGVNAITFKDAEQLRQHLTDVGFTFIMD